MIFAQTESEKRSVPGIAWKMAVAAGGAGEGEAMEKVGGPEGSKEGWDDTVESEERTHLHGGSLEVLRSARKERSECYSSEKVLILILASALRFSEVLKELVSGFEVPHSQQLSPVSVEMRENCMKLRMLAKACMLPFS